MKRAFIVFKKEIRRFFTDPRMLLALFLPGILIFSVYSALGNVLTSSFSETKVEQTTYRIAYTDNSGAKDPLLIQSYDAYLKSAESEKTNKVEFFTVPIADVEAAKEEVSAGKYDVLIEFSDGFEKEIKSSSAVKMNNHVYLFYNGASASGTRAYQTLNAMIDAAYKDYVINIDPNGRPVKANLGKTDYQGNRFLAMLIPMLTMSMLFSAVIAICPDAVAGEKERGTLSSILLTPIKRSELALGKVAALSITAAASGLVSFAGLMGGLPSMMQGIKLDLSPLSIFLLAILIISSLIFFVAIGTVVSTLAKSSKECGTLLSPFMIIAMAVSLLPMSISSNNLAFAFVPFLNVAMTMSNIVTGNAISYGFIAITIGMNFAFTAILIGVVGRLFQSERFMVK